MHQLVRLWKTVKDTLAILAVGSAHRRGFGLIGFLIRVAVLDLFLSKVIHVNSVRISIRLYASHLAMGNAVITNVEVKG